MRHFTESVHLIKSVQLVVGTYLFDLCIAAFECTNTFPFHPVGRLSK